MCAQVSRMQCKRKGDNAANKTLRKKGKKKSRILSLFFPYSNPKRLIDININFDLFLSSDVAYRQVKLASSAANRGTN